jgi:putative ABC transport system substrate-binding protein
MDRRSFIRSLAAAILAAPAAAPAQPSKVYRIGVLEAIPAEQNAANLRALRDGLRKLGYEEGRNLIVEYRSADGHAERFPELASDLVRLDVDLILTRGTPATSATKNATHRIPIVMATMGDVNRLVSSFAHPGGNITGVTTFSTELSAKRVQLLAELAPNVRSIALLHNMGNPAAASEWEETKRASHALGRRVELLDVRSKRAFGGAFERALHRRIDGIVIGADGLTQLHRQTIVDLASRNRMATACPGREFVEVGGLFAYGVDYPELYARLARYADKIFKGANPADIPVEQPAKFQLVINRKSAEALGLNISQSLLLRADEVIQ